MTCEAAAPGETEEATAMRRTARRRPEKRAREAVRELRIPPLDPADPLGDLVSVMEERLGYSITVVNTENDSIINGALEARPGGGTAIVVPAGTRTPNRRRHLVCRGLARCLHREPGNRTGRIDYSTVIEQEIEYTALFLGRHVHNAHQDGPGALRRDTWAWRARLSGHALSREPSNACAEIPAVK